MTLRSSVSPTRILGVVTRIVKDRAFLFVRTGDDTEIFVHRSGCNPPSRFDDAEVGQAVSLQTMQTDRGLRGFDIKPATEEEQGLVDQMEENRGNQR